MFGKDRIPVLILFAIAIYFPIFLHLDYNALFLWDESRNALSALEMLENGNYLRKFHLGTPDSWDTKPPMLIWLQAISIKIFGPNELAIRFPSALAALGTVMLILWFFIRQLKDFWGGIFSGLVLLTSSGYVRLHVTRTGDNDALLLLFLTAGFIFYYLFLNGPPKNQKKYLALFTVSLIGGVLTKSIAGLYFAPGLLLYTIISGKLKYTLTSSAFWLSVLGFFIGVGGYYGLAEYYYPGYLQFIWESELFPRFFNSSDLYSYNQMPEPHHFTKILYQDNFKYYSWFLPLGLLFIALKNDSFQTRFMLAVLLTALTFHLVISNGTYNSWYNAPIFPLLAILTGMGMSLVFNSLINYLNLTKIRFIIFACAFVLGCFAIPYHNIITKNVYFYKNTVPFEHYGDYLHHLRRTKPEYLDNLHVYYEILNSHYLFYDRVYNQYLGYSISSCGAGPNIKGCPEERKAEVGDYVMICADDIKVAFAAIYNAPAIDRYKNCELYLVKELIKEKPENPTQQKNQ